MRLDGNEEENSSSTEWFTKAITAFGSLAIGVSIFVVASSDKRRDEPRDEQSPGRRITPMEQEQLRRDTERARENMFRGTQWEE